MHCFWPNPVFTAPPAAINAAAGWPTAIPAPRQIATGQPISDQSIGLTDAIAMGAAQTVLKAIDVARPFRLRPLGN